MSRPLICVTGSPEEPGAMRFACSLVTALCERGKTVAVLLADASAGAAHALEHAGAIPRLLDPDTDLRSVATTVLDALPADCIAVALSTALAEQLEAVLTVMAVPVLRADPARTEPTLDAVLGRDAELVARLIADWLSTNARINAHTETHPTQ